MRGRDVAWVTIGLALGGSDVAASEGFGFLHGHEANLVVVRPPRVAVAGKRLVIRVTSTESTEGSLSRRLGAELESELSRRGCLLAVDAASAEADLEIKILAHGRSERWQHPSGLLSSLAQLSGQTASAALDEVVRDTLRIAYSVRIGYRDLDADTLEIDSALTVHQGESAPSAAETEGHAVVRVVAELADRVTPSRTGLAVLVPRGELERFGSLAETGQWSLYRRALEQVPVRTPRAESYRQYGLGLAHEAEAYESRDAEAAVPQLELAESCYAAALKANPAESYFTAAPLETGRATGRAPLHRVRAILAAYRRTAAERADGTRAPTGSTVGSSTAGAKLMDNTVVMAMSAAGVPAEVILRSLEATPARFDVSPAALMALVAAKVDRNVILRMQELAMRRETLRPGSRPPLR